MRLLPVEEVVSKTLKPLQKHYGGPEHNDYYVATDHLCIAIAVMTPAQRVTTLTDSIM